MSLFSSVIYKWLYFVSSKDSDVASDRPYTLEAHVPNPRYTHDRSQGCITLGSFAILEAHLGRATITDR